MALSESELGHFEAAMAYAEQAIATGHGGATPYLCAAFAAGRLAGDDAALSWINRALTVEPRHALALGTRTQLLRTAGRVAEALGSCRQWVTVEPGNGRAQLCLAQLCQAQGMDEESLEAYARATDLLPAPAETLTDWSILLQELGRREAASQVLDRALAADNSFAAAWYTRANAKRFCAIDADVQAMEALLPRDSTPTEPRAIRDSILLHYALAKAYADLLDIPRALEHLGAGSRLKRAGLNYASAIDQRIGAAIAAAFPRQTVERLAASGDQSELPVFILGMPRSGTTLVEQILASHPLVHGAGETTHIQGLVAELGADYPDRIHSFMPAQIAEMARRYLAAVAERLPASRGYSPDAHGLARITDKMPYNFLHVGLIHAMFPRARIVHCMRNPLDNCFSCYATLFSSGHEFSYDLTELGRYYRAYADLMAHWRSVIAADRLLEVEYEKVVDDLDGQARRLIDFCGLPWDEAMPPVPRERASRAHREPAPGQATALSRQRWPREVVRERLGRAQGSVGRPRLI